MTEKVAVLGAGNMGTALAQVLATNGHHVRLWSIEHDVLDELRDKRLNTKYLEGVQLSDNIEAVWDLDKAVEGARLVVISVPSQVVRRVAKDIAPMIRPGQIVLNVAKGLENDTNKRMSEIVCEELDDACSQFVGSMGGPAIAIEMARGQPLAIIIGVADRSSCATTQRLLQNDNLKVATTNDVVGLELCSTLKNVYAIALGMCDGLGYGTNLKAFLASIALNDIAAIVDSLGGQRDTAYGLAGIGDLLTTGFSSHSRNRTLGEHLGSGSDWQEFLRTNTVEGVGATRSIKQMLSGKSMYVPLLTMIHEVLFAETPTPEAMRRFITEFSYN